jgi:hypothetical protein
VHQAVIQADHCAGLTDNAVARRVVLAPCAGTAVIAGAAVSGIGAAASVVGSGCGSRCDSTGANRCAGGRGPTRLPPGSARGSMDRPTGQPSAPARARSTAKPPLVRSSQTRAGSHMRRRRRRGQLFRNLVVS